MSEFENETAEATEPDAPEAPAATPAWAPPQDEWSQVQRFISQSAPLLGQLSELMNDPGQQAAPEMPELDPFDPESVQRYVDQRAEAIAAAQMEPFKGILGMISAREGEALAKAELDKISEEVGEFDKDTAFLIASGLIDQGGDPGQALRQAAGFAKEFESRVRQDERTKVEEELRTRVEAPHEPAIGSTTGETPQTVPTGPGRYEEAIQRALARRSPSMPVG